MQTIKSAQRLAAQKHFGLALLGAFLSLTGYVGQGVEAKSTSKSAPLDRFTQWFHNEWTPDATMIILETQGGDIYQTEFLDTLRQITDEVFFMPGVDRSSITSLFTRNIGPTGKSHPKNHRAALIPHGYKTDRPGLAEIRSNVKRADIVGTLVSPDHTTTAVVTKILKHNPVTGEALDEVAVHKTLKAIQEKFADRQLQLHIIGFGAEAPPAPKPKGLDGQELPPAELISLDTVAHYNWLQDLVICKTSWEEMEPGSPEWETLKENSSADLTYGEREHPTPNKPMDILGFPVTHVSPGSFGMALGSMAFVAAPFEEVVKATENWIGGRLSNCGGRACMGYKFSEKRHLMIFPEKSENGLPNTVIGCYYRYQQ